MSPSPPVDLEVCVDSLESALQAAKQGASCVELCVNAKEGGYSPSIGLLKVVKSQLSNLPIIVVVRPQRQDYVYTDSEFEMMQEEVILAIQHGASGFVFGILTQNNDIDLKRCSILINRCRPLPCTFSRAFDVVSNPVLALEDLIKIGFDRILVSTDRYNGSGGLINTLKDQAQGRIKVIPTRNTAASPNTDRLLESLVEENRRLQDEMSRVKLEALCREDQNKAPGLSVAALLTHPSVLSKLRTIDLRPILLDLLRDDGYERFSTSSPIQSSPASPQVREMASVNRLRNISPSCTESSFKTLASPEHNGMEYVSAFTATNNTGKPTIMVSSDLNNPDGTVKPPIQRKDSLQVPDLSCIQGVQGHVATYGHPRSRSLDLGLNEPSNSALYDQQPIPLMEPVDLEPHMNPQMKKERSLSAPEALFYPSIADQVLAFKQVADARMLAKEQGQQARTAQQRRGSFEGQGGHQGHQQQHNMRMWRMNIRRGPLQKKLDALKASTHIDEEFNAVMNVPENNNNIASDDMNINLNHSLQEMEIDDYNMKFKRKRSYGPNQKKIDDSNLMHALKSGLECTRTLKQESDFNVFKKEVETLYEHSECINERTILCGKCGKTHHLSWLRYHQQFNKEHWIHCRPDTHQPILLDNT